jgi:hypothetical protein
LVTLVPLVMSDEQAIAGTVNTVLAPVGLRAAVAPSY